MNKIVRVEFGNTEISASAYHEITVAPHPDFEQFVIATKRDQHGREMQAMILGTGCKITWEEVQA